MSSVQTQVECPQCNHHADYDFNTRSGEEWTQCGHCGYLCEVKWVQPKLDSVRLRLKRREILGCGSARYQMKDEIVYHRISLRKSKRGNYVQWVLNNVDALSFATMTIQQEDGDWREVVLLGKAPDDEQPGDDWNTSSKWCKS